MGLQSSKEDRRCIKWGERVLAAEGCGDWTIKFSPSGSGQGSGVEGIALFGPRTIYIHWPHGSPDYPLMLHEIAHACKGSSGHDSEFSHQYMRLVGLYFDVRVEVGEKIPKGG